MANNAIKAVFFDFDGTLTFPGALDFQKIKHAIGCPAETPILEFIDGLGKEPDKKKAGAILDSFELEAAAVSQPNSGCEGLIRLLINLDLKVGIISRNSLKSIGKALENFTGIDMGDFNTIVSRDSGVAVKPAPDGILLAAKNVGIPTEQVMMVGDYIFDLQAGRSAGAYTVLLGNAENRIRWAGEYDRAIESLDELARFFQEGL